MTKAARRRSRQLLSLFVIGMVALTSVLIRGFTKDIQSVSAATKDTFDFYRIKKVHTGDQLEMYNDDRTVLIRLRGVVAPPADPDAIPAFAQRSGLSPKAVAKAAEASRQILSVWGNHQNVLVEPKGTALPPGPGPHTIYITIGGIDVGRKQISQGFALPAEIEHPRNAEYQTFKTEAQNQQRGMWTP